MATVVKNRYWLYKVDPNKKNTVQVKITSPKQSYDLLAVSTQGDVALYNYGNFVIYQPERDKWEPNLILIGNPMDNSGRGYGCFAAYRDREYFIFCGKRYVEIAIAMRTDEIWSSVYCCHREDPVRIPDRIPSKRCKNNLEPSWARRSKKTSR